MIIFGTFNFYRKFVIYSLIIFGSIQSLYAQDDEITTINQRTQMPLGLNAGILYFPSAESGYFLANMDYFLTPHVDLQLNIGSGFDTGAFFSAGSRFHIYDKSSNKNFTPFTGFLIGYESGSNFIQIPIGVNYMSSSGFNASLSVNGLIFTGQDNQSTFLEALFGWKFNL